MKKSLLFITTIIISISSQAQLWEGFENWTQYNVQTLDNYETSVNDRGIDGAAASYSVNDPITGVLSIKLETVIGSQGDTIFGYFIDGDPDNMTPGQAVSLNNVDSVIGWYKYDIQPNDSALFICMTTFTSNPSGGGLYYIQGSQPTWKRFAYYVGAPAVDSLLLGSASSDAMNFQGIPGSWIQFDDIQLKSSTGQLMNVMNYSFENWTPLNWEEPNGWQTGNTWAIGQPTMPAVKTTDSYAGTYALELNILPSNTQGDTLWGAATNGYWGNNGATGGVPFAGSPIGVECYYKYAPVSGDNAFLSFEFRQGGNIVGSYGGNFTTTVNTYTLWSQALTPMNPDTLLIAIWGGNKIGSQLKIDNIDVVFPVGIVEGLTVEKLVTYPNPATDELKIRFNIENNNDVTIKLIDITGKTLISRPLGNLSAGTYRESFNTSIFSSGVYFIEFTLGEEKIVKKFVVK